MTESTFKIIARELLHEMGKPMSAKQLVNTAIARGLLSDQLHGKTPHQTMKSKLSVDIRRKGANSEFVRTKKGTFFLRRLLTDPGTEYHAKPIKPPPSKEQVLVIPGRVLDEAGLRFQGIKAAPVALRLLRRLSSARAFRYVPRLEAERDESYKQILTYILVTRGPRLLAYKRGTYTRVEDFLRGSHCVGFGGHVNYSDLDLLNFADHGIRASAARELAEELHLPNADAERLKDPSSLELLGLLNDDSSPTGRRHLAFVFRYSVSADADWDMPKRNEKSITQLRWIDPGASPVTLWQFEYWSQLCLIVYYRHAPIVRPAYRIVRKQPLAPPHVLCVLGSIGSGKSQATRLLVRQHGYAEVNSGQVVSELIGVPFRSESDREHFQKAASRFIRSKTGPKRLAGALWKEVVAQRRPKVLIDGIRQRSTLTELGLIAREQSTRLGVLFIHTLPFMAYRFYMSRPGKTVKASAGPTLDRLLTVRAADVESEVEGLIGVADAIVYNWMGVSTYGRLLSQLLREARTA